MKTAMQLMEELGLHEGGVENWIPGNAWETFADLIRADERAVWERRVARLQSLMDVRESQPNKPCCLAEREACANLCEENMFFATGEHHAKAIRARGNT